MKRCFEAVAEATTLATVAARHRETFADNVGGNHGHIR